MMEGRSLIIAVVALVAGFIGGFVLRPVISPPVPAMSAATAPMNVAPPAARGTQYFVAHIDEARRILSGCRDGSVRGEECANAERAVTEVEGRDRFRKFMGH